MSSYFKISLLAIFSLLLLMSVYSFSGFAANEDVLAKVNNQVITSKDVDALYEQSPARKQGIAKDAIRAILVDQLIGMTLIDEQVKRSNLAQDEQALKAIEQAKAETLRDIWLKNELEKRLSEESLKERYNQIVQDSKDEKEVHARHILLPTKEEALDVIKELDGGADFLTIAKEKSIGPSGEKGGDLGYFTKGAMVPSFSEAAFSLDVGAYTKEPAQTQFGWHVIYVEDNRKLEAPSFEAVEPRIRAELSRATLDDILQELQKEAKIERFDEERKSQ